MRIYGSKRYFKVCEISRERVEKGNRRIRMLISNNQELRKEMLKLQNVEYTKKLLEFLYRSMSLDGDIFRYTEKILKSKSCISELRKSNKNNVFAWVAAAIYLASKNVSHQTETRNILTQNHIAEKLEISTVTLREYYKFLEDLLRKKSANAKTQSATSTNNVGV